LLNVLCPPFLFFCVLTPAFFFLSVNSFLKPLSPYFPLPWTALDWTWGKGRKDVFIQYITKFTKVQSHVSLKNLLKSNSANGIIRTPDWLTCRVKEVFYDHCPFVNIYCRASYDGQFLPSFASKQYYKIDWFLIFGVLTPLSTIFQLYHGDQF
jgi:hypothetical protein